jgi:hypothetical protein
MKIHLAFARMVQVQPLLQTLFAWRKKTFFSKFFALYLFNDAVKQGYFVIHLVEISPW